MKFLLLFVALSASAQSKLPLMGMGGASAISSPIARNGSCSAATTACTFSATATGSLKIAFAYRSASTTAPSLPAGWTNISTGATAATGTVGSYRLGCNVSSSSADTGTGTWTSATDVVGISYSGTEAVDTASCATLAAGVLATNNAKTSTTLNYPAITLGDNSGLSWVDGLAGTSVASPCAPTGMSSVSTVGAGPAIIGSDTNAGVISWASTNCTISSGTWMSAVLEIFGQTKPTVAPKVVQSTFSQQSCVGPPACDDATSYNSSVTAGNTLIVIGLHTNWSGSGTSTTTDTLGNTWKACGSTSSAAFTDLQIFSGFGASCHYAVNALGGADTVHMVATDCTSGCTNTGGYYLEFSGLATTAAGIVDGSVVTNLSATSGSGSNNMSAGTLSTSAPGDIVIGIFDNASGTCTVGTDPTRFTMESNTTSYCLEWAAWGGKGSITPKLTLSSSGISYGAMAVAFKHP